jgi:predicted permease
LSLDWRILGFTALVAIGTAVVFGLAPALRASRVPPNDALKEQGRAMAGERHGSLGSPLVVAQVALSLLLVVAAGLFVRTFTTLANRDLGFTFDPLLVVSIDAERNKTPQDQRPALFERLAQAVASVPGIEKSAVSAVTPVSGMMWNNRFEFPELPSLSQRDRTMNINFVTPGWFATYGTPILSGRDFDSRDRAGAPGVAIVNEAYVAKFVKSGVNPLEQLVRPQARGNQPAPAPLQIVGVVRNSVYRSVRDPAGPIVYRPMAQAEEFPPFVSATVRSTNGSATLLTKSITTAIGQVDADLSLTFRPLAEQIRGSLAQERVIAILSGFFGALALLLAGIGLYGVTSYAVSRRRTEIGIRMALGADANGVVRLVLRRVGILVGIGVVVGTGISIWASRFVGTLLYGLEPRDPLTFAGAVAVLGTIGALAGWLPARRAARIDPAEALRQG